MSTQPQKTETTVKAANAEPEFLLTKNGTMLVGAELIGEKLMGLVIEILANHADASVACIEFRNDNYPADADGPVFAMAYADTHSFAVNLEQCWHSACVDASKGEEPLGFLGMLWINVLSAVGHELDHLDIAGIDRVEYEKMRVDDKLVIALEESAAETAKTEILRLARVVDTEIPAAEGLGWFGIKLMGLFTTDSTKDLDWVLKLQKDMENGIVYNDGEDRQCFTFRDFIKKAHDPEGKTGNWEQPTTAVNLSAELETGEIITAQAEPVEEVKVEVIPVAEAAEVVAAEEVPQTMFVGAGTTVGDEGPDVVMADGVDAAGAPTIVMAAEPTAMEALAAANPTLPAADTVAAQATAVAAPDTGITEVPLPTTVVAAQAANTPPAQATPATTYEQHPCTLDLAIAPQVMESLWKTLYHHIFTKCGWQQDPTTGKFFFSNAAGVLEFVSIQHIIDSHGAQNFVMECDGQSAVGASHEGINCTTGMVKGFVSSDKGLPCYNIYLNINGQRIKRSFIPQNPEKMNASNAYSPPALEAQQGHMIAWIMKGEVADGADFKVKCAVKMRDNAYEVIS
jgi:hypothetical protein